MPALTHQRCFHHAGREAAALCPSCRRFFCRECVTEHDGRVTCAACLSQQAVTPSTRRGWAARVSHAAQVAVALIVAFLFFYGVGRGLLLLPEAFHEGTLWRGSWLESL